MIDTKALRQKILDLAIRGKLVPQDPDDEPASVLLERIRQQKQQMVKEGKLKPKDIKNDSVIFVGEDNLHYEKFSNGSVKCIEDEIPFDIPGSWAWVRISSICVINPKNDLNDDTEVSFIPMPHICEGYENRHSFDIRKWSEIKTGYTHFAENDIGIAKITPCFENRKSVVFHNLKNGAGAGTTELFILRPIISVEPDYLLWIAKTDDFINGGVETFSAAVGQQRVDRDFLVNYLIPLPPVNEQKSIINKINVAFSVINTVDQNKADLANTIFYAKSKILDLAIRGQLVPQDPDDEPASVLLERIRAEKEELIKQGKIKRDKKESVIFRGEDNSYYLRTGELVESLEDWDFEELPDSWSVCFLGELCDYGNCINVNTVDIAESAWMLDLEDIEKDSGVVLQKVRKAERNAASTKHRFHKGQVLYSKLRPYLNKVVLADEDGYCTSEILPLEFERNIIPQYARYYLMSPTFLRYANKCSYGVKMPRLGTADGTKAIIPVPPLEEQKRIVIAIEQTFSQLAFITENLS